MSNCKLAVLTLCLLVVVVQELQGCPSDSEDAAHPPPKGPTVDRSSSQQKDMHIDMVKRINREILKCRQERLERPMEIHMETHSPNFASPRICPICEKHFYTLDEYEKHLVESLDKDNYHYWLNLVHEDGDEKQ